MATAPKRTFPPKTTKSRGKRKSVSVNPFYECSVLFCKDADNVIYQVTSDQLPVLNRIGLDDLFMTKGHIREPHWHPNAAELDYVVTGEVNISMVDPVRHRLLAYHVTPGEVVFIPINWWHWITALSDEVHVVQIFSHAKRQIIEGSDVLRKTPAKIFQSAYDVNAKQFASLLSPITGTVVIGPPNSMALTNTSDDNVHQHIPRATNRTYPGSPNLFFDLQRNLTVRRDQSCLYEVTSVQIPMMQVLSLGDLFLTKGHVREPHWHPNADELDYVVAGEVTVSILDPNTLRVASHRLKPGQVTFIPKGWFHWIVPDTEDAHLLVCFNDGRIESVEGSDVLRLTPPEVFQQAYDIHARQFAKEIAPIAGPLTIGPPSKPAR
ncbi:cupin domain-containing protein [Alicyclobacillus shizuokensis]|uniref:cupin domain-containing protein n=1 Tax=Alicyclobacillus shizuokensis TaxID=392014 RepID=UPI0008300EE9|nr:cupin domain-containing protein [Alicyclobacillus shizuokensis]MCL6627850.1 cupin domain-containing protein [Alicyclobacillus shizuokensis]